MKRRFGNDVCSIINRYIFYDLYTNVMTELLHRTSDITYLYNLYLKSSNIRCICVCKTCLYYWTWTSVYTKPECRHCVNRITKGTDLNNEGNFIFRK